MKKTYLDALRVIYALGVVLLHSNEGIWTFSYDKYWLESTVVTMLFFCAVPCFIMISGALLIDYSERYSTKVFIKKRVEKTLVPYIAWSLIGICYLIFRDVLDINQLTIKSIIYMIVNNEVLPIYWFFPAIFTIYLLTPVLTSIPNHKRKKVLEYVIISLLIFNVVVPFFSVILGFGVIQIQMPITTLCLFYVAGYYIDRYPIPGIVRIWIYFLAMLGFIILLVGTITASYKAGSLVETYMGCTNFPRVFFSFGIFCAFKQLSERCAHKHACTTEGIPYKLIALFVNETLGIYLVHWYILNEFKIHFGLNYADFMYRIPIGIVTFFISWLIIKMLRMIPIVKRIVP